MMMKNGWIRIILKKNWDYAEGVIDVGIIVVAHCDNLAKLSMVHFLGKVFEGEIPAIIPVSICIGA